MSSLYKAVIIFSKSSTHYPDSSHTQTVLQGYAENVLGGWNNRKNLPIEKIFANFHVLGNQPFFDIEVERGLVGGTIFIGRASSIPSSEKWFHTTETFPCSIETDYQRFLRQVLIRCFPASMNQKVFEISAGNSAKLDRLKTRLR